MDSGGQLVMGGSMSRYLGRVLRVYTGWRAVPGKNLVIFDDCLVGVRASALDGLATRGAASAAARRAGASANAALDSLSPDQLVSQHADNWMLPTAQVTSATLASPGLGIRRRLTVTTETGSRVVEWEARSNNNQQIANALRQVLGNRFSVGKRA
jgi:hypothetical protein